MTGPEPQGASTALARAPIADGGLESALQLSDVMSDLAVVIRNIAEGIEQVTDLRLGQLRAMHAIADGAEGWADVGRATSEHREAARATVRSLQRAALVTEVGAPPVLRLTEQGRARLDQLTGLQIRLLAVLPPSLKGPLADLAEGLAELRDAAADEGRTLGAGRPQCSVAEDPQALPSSVGVP